MDISINRIGSVPYHSVPYATISYRNVQYRTVPYYSLTETSHYRYSAVTLFNAKVGLWSSYSDYLYNAQGLYLYHRIRAPYDALCCGREVYALYRQLLGVPLGHRAIYTIIALRSGYGKA